MIRNLKVLGMALVALCAMSAMLASAASAHTPAQFTASNGKGTVITATDTGKVKFTVTGSEVFCEEASYTGEAPAASFTSVTVNASFKKCFVPGIGEAQVTGFGAGGCDFVLRASGTADLVCPEGKDVTVDAVTCVVHIPAQANLGTLTYTNGAGDVNIGLNVTKILGNHTDGFLCPFGSSGNSSEGILETPATEPLTAKASAGTIQFDATIP